TRRRRARAAGWSTRSRGRVVDALARQVVDALARQGGADAGRPRRHGRPRRRGRWTGRAPLPFGAVSDTLAFRVETKLEPGALLADRYRLDRILGEGGMGVVWLATHHVTRKPVALKFVKLSGDVAAQRARVLREARASCAVRHPNVREVYDILEAPDGSPL